ncbi:MAG TPA: S41 family peptidase [Thermoanaerobaculia bacterium]|nr:S41 family peptidase [Thermoanaerobaculia bacterium]
MRGRRRAESLRLLTVAVLAAVALGRVGAQPAPPVEPGADRRALYLATFDGVWSLVADTHFDPELGGVDWNALRDELRPKAAAATTDRELRRVLDELIGGLGQSHFAILPRADAASGEALGLDPDLLPDCAPAVRAEILVALEAPSAGDSDPGFVVRVLEEDQVVVTRVAPDGPAAKLGVATGWRLLAIDGLDLAGHLDCLAQLGGGRFRHQLVGSWLASLLDGAPRTIARMRFETADSRRVDLEVRRERGPGQRVGFGDLPPSRFHFEVEEAETPRGARVGVVRFNLWLLPVAPAFEQAMPALRAADAVVIDLRGNPGGVAMIAQGVASHFVAEALSLGSLKSRRDHLELVVEPRRVARDGTRVEPHGGPLAILVDRGTASTSELFAAGLRDHGRARLFGAPTAGAALPAITDRLPNGDVFLHASMDYIRPNGEPVEGRPLVPDVEAELTREDLVAGRDAALHAALAWIDQELKEKR